MVGEERTVTQLVLFGHHQYTAVFGHLKNLFLKDQMRVTIFVTIQKQCFVRK